MPEVRTLVYLTLDQRRRLEARAIRDHTTVASVIRDAVDAYTADDPPEVETALASTFGALPRLDVPKREWGRGRW
jgi:hypothetical protein